jgi:hypothetical protein
MNTKTLLVGVLLAFAPALLTDLSFSYNEVGADVGMTSFGTSDTSQTDTAFFSGQDGVDAESNGAGGGDVAIHLDIMDLTDFDPLDQSFEFHVGTDVGASANSVVPFAISPFGDWETTDGPKSFAAYSGFGGGLPVPGLSSGSSGVGNGSWAPDHEWTNPNDTVASPGLDGGVDPIDSPIDDAITIQTNEGASRAASVPDGGATIALLGVSLAGLAMLRSRRVA